MLLPLGFGMGPGIAYSVGQSWHSYGFLEAANIGLTLAAIGFLVAYFTGVFVVNRGIRNGLSKLQTDQDAAVQDTSKPDPTTQTESFVQMFGMGSTLPRAGKEMEAIRAANFLTNNDDGGAAWISFNRPAATGGEAGGRRGGGRRRRA